MKNSFSKITSCRISGSTNLLKVLTLGNSTLTGVFPPNKSQEVTVGPLDLVWCTDSGLLQLGHSYDLNEMYGDNYGYRSGLNQSMVNHLVTKVQNLTKFCPLKNDDLVVDIGSNDGTLLNSYGLKSLRRVGIDPTGLKFKDYYEDGIDLIPDFFSAQLLQNLYANAKAKIITSISMFYDLENPFEFVKNISQVLDKEGIWHFEQSYMPAMLRQNAYDTICHEHLEYYSLNVVKNLLERADLKIIDVQMNSVNGGSFAVTASHSDSKYQENIPLINWLLGQEERMELHTPKPYQDFAQRIFGHREDLVQLINNLKNAGKTICGYGASTKGNVLLQFCGFSTNHIDAIAEVNEQKYGCFTPGSLIPIMSEEEVKSSKPDYMLVLPWHFKDSIIKREAEYLASGGKLIFPLPEIEII